MARKDTTKRIQRNKRRIPERAFQEQKVETISESERQLKIGKEIMQEYRATLAALAKK